MQGVDCGDSGSGSGGGGRDGGEDDDDDDNDGDDDTMKIVFEMSIEDAGAEINGWLSCCDNCASVYAGHLLISLGNFAILKTYSNDMHRILA
jgi:hypothetical protein